MTQISIGQRTLAQNWNTLLMICGVEQLPILQLMFRVAGTMVPLLLLEVGQTAALGTKPSLHLFAHLQFEGLALDALKQ